MTTSCPKCQHENPDDTVFCGKCGTKFDAGEEIPVHTETIEAPREDLTTGSTFAGRYQIVEELGKGGMGKVYKAQDTEIKEKVALKLIKPEISLDKKTIERFQNELKFARKIGHRNVCRMYDLNKEEGSYYITMEYVSGEDLKSFIRRSEKLTVGKAISLAKQICDGLAEAHRLGVVHRDLKPGNIMIDKDGNAKIMDFGIARSLGEKGITGAGVMIGTPEYMSPEQVEGKETDQRSDIYALGVILFEMVTGRVPFEGDMALSIAVKHKTEEPKDPKEYNAQLPEDLSGLILRCLAKEKDKRYQSADEVRSELADMEKGIPTTERIIPERKPLTSKEITVQFSLKRAFVPALVVIAFVIIGVIIWQLLPEKEPYLAPKIENSIAVISFENQTGDEAYDYLQKAIPNLLITNLENTGFLHVATWERMYDLLKQMDKGNAEVIDRDLGFELCRREGIESIVLGSFIKAEEVFATDIKVLDVESKKLLKSTNTRGKGLDSILENQIDELSREIVRGVGLAEQKVEEANLKVADVTTTSMEALNYFIRGREECEKLYWEEAQKFLEKAIQLDSSFAAAHLYLALTHFRLGSTEEANASFEKAKTFSERATEKERLYIEHYYAAYVEMNYEKSYHILTQMAEKYPREKKVHFGLCQYFHTVKIMFPEAIEEGKRALELDPDYGKVFNQLGLIYGDMSNYEKAIEYLTRYTSVSPGDANPLDSIAHILIQMGKVDEAIAKYKEALEIKPDFYFSLLWLPYAHALKEDFAEALRSIDQYIARMSTPGNKAEGFIWKALFNFLLGCSNESIDNLNKGGKLAEEAGNLQWQSQIEWMKGWFFCERGDLELSREYYQSWFSFCERNFPQFNLDNKALYNYFLGIIDLKQKKARSAKSRLVEIKSYLPNAVPFFKAYITYYYNCLAAELFLIEGAFNDAIDILGEVPILEEDPRIWDTYNFVPYNLDNNNEILARVYVQLGDLSKAIIEYEQLTTFNPHSIDRRLINPKNYYRLAKLYEQTGQKGKAKEHYEKFLDLWKDANPGIAEVDDARERLAGLKN